MFVRVTTVKVIVNVCSDGGQVELPPFDPKLERTLHWLRRELRESQQRNLTTMQNNEGHNQDQEQTSCKVVAMGIMVGIMRPGRLYGQMISLCC